MNILFEQRMQMLLKDEYQNFKNALLKKPIKAFYLNPKKKRCYSTSRTSIFN